MTDFSDITYDDIDWLQLWRNARHKRGWSSKGPKDWDKKSASFASRNRRSPYIDLLLDKLPLTSEMTVLDVGCGPGTLALPLAQQVKAVTALDFSPGMLEQLHAETLAQNITNIHAVECAWEDNWQEKGIRAHDISIASRSMNVEDIAGAINKLNTFARKYVFIVDRISPTPFDPALFAAVGRNFNSGPDYIYTVNILYSMGIHPNIDIIELEDTVRFDNIAQAMLSYSWMIKDITPAEEQKLLEFLEATAIIDPQGGLTIKRQPPPRWAVIWWPKNND